MYTNKFTSIGNVLIWWLHLKHNKDIDINCLNVNYIMLINSNDKAFKLLYTLSYDEYLLLYYIELSNLWHNVKRSLICILGIIVLEYRYIRTWFTESDSDTELAPVYIGTSSLQASKCNRKELKEAKRCMQR